MFEKSLSDLVKGIRSHRDTESAYISKRLAEIKTEIKSADLDIKAQALQKLIYLQMMGYDFAWASFHVVEVMSQPWFGHRRIGYLAASLCFTPDTDVILLTTHLFRKAFTTTTSSNTSTADGLMYETGASVNCLANIVTRDLAMDLLSDIYGMMNSSRPYVRKKAVLVLLRVFLVWPKALRLSFDRLKDKLTDTDASVVSAAVYVLCELARKNPRNYLKLAPLFFKILTTSSNNWVLIKVVKLMGNLVPLEPRLAKKLTQPLVDIIEVTPAKSLLYECVNTLVSGELTSKSVIRLCLDKLRMFIEDPDQNLKYLGLLGLHKLMKQHPRAVAEHKDLILDCLSDEDVTIRMRALDLLGSMVSVRNLKSIIRRLVEHLHLVDGHYRQIVLDRIVQMCCQMQYAFVADFEWYIQTLVELTHIEGASKENAARVTQQLMDVLIRVEGVRPFGTRCMADLIVDGRLLGTVSKADKAEEGAAGSGAGGSSNPMTDVLYAAGWIVGEYADVLQDHCQVLTSMLNPRVLSLSGQVQNVFIQNVVKVFASGLAKQHKSPAGSGDAALSHGQWWAEVRLMVETITTQLPQFTRSSHVEVQERAVTYSAFIQWLVDKLVPLNAPHDISMGPESKLNGHREEKESKEHKAAAVDLLSLDPLADSTTPDVSASASAAPAGGSTTLPSNSHEQTASLVEQLRSLFSEPLNPLHPKAQKKVPLPRGLNLDVEINPQQPDSEDEDDFSLDLRRSEFNGTASPFESPRSGTGPLSPEQKLQAARRRKAEVERRKHDPYYIKDSGRNYDGSVDGDHVNVDDIPIKQPDFDLPKLEVRAQRADRGLSSRGRPRTFSEEDVGAVPKYTVKTGLAMPSGAKDDSTDDDAGDDDNLDTVDLSKPLQDDEVIPRVQTYADRQRAQAEKGSSKSKKKAEKKRKKEKHKRKDKKKDRRSRDTPSGSKSGDILGMFDPMAAESSPSQPSEEGPSSSPASSKRHKDKKRKHKHKSSTSSASAAAESKGYHRKVHPAHELDLWHDDTVRVYAHVTSTLGQGKSAIVHVVTSVAPTGPIPTGPPKVDRVRVTAHNTSTVRAKSGSPGVMADIGRGEVKSLDIQLQLAKLSQIPSLTMETVVSAEGKDSSKRKEVQLPCSSFVHPNKISIEALQEILAQTSDRDDSRACKRQATAKYRLSRHSVQQALKLVGKVLNVALLEAVSFTATYYGQSIQGHHVAVLVKANKDQVHAEAPPLSVTIKASKQFLADALLEELAAVFGQ